MNVCGRKKLVFGFGLLAAACLVSEMQAWIHGRDFFYLAGPDFTGGPPGILSLGVWIALLVPVLAAAGIRMEQERKCAGLTLLRYGKACRWWRKLWLENLGDCLVYLGLLYVLCGGSGTAAQTSGSLLLLWLHLQLLTGVLYLFRFCAAGAEGAMACVLLLEGMGLWFCAPYTSLRNWFPGFWAMWNAGGCELADGYPVAVAAAGQGALLLAVSALLLRKRILETR